MAVQAATPAGSIITNVADIHYVERGTSLSLHSNRVDIRVDELIRFTVTPVASCGNVAGSRVIAFRITNLGNGVESFVPGLPEVIEGDFTPSGVFEDSNRNGCYDPGIDRMLAAGEHTPPLAAGDMIVIFVVGTGGAGPVRIRLAVRSGTVTDAAINGAPGGSGDGGGSVVVGDGDGTVIGDSFGGETSLVATLVKSQSVVAPDGSATPRRGALITYSVESRFAGQGIAANAAIADAVPGGTIYVPNSLTLDGRRLSDGEGDDAGSFGGGTVTVRLGDIVAPAVRRVTFQVRIN